MGELRNIEKEVINEVYKNSLKMENKNKEIIDNILKNYNINVSEIIKNMLSKQVTINFHPDRLTVDKQLIVESLIEDGKYLSQFRTKTTNGGKSAYIGGDRFIWEQRLFLNKYSEDNIDRPKYGALNILDYLDGASPRFGSCYFILNEKVLERCTFSYGDSFSNPDIVCTINSFNQILAKSLEDVVENNCFLNIKGCSLSKAIDILSDLENSKPKMGKDLDEYIEVHIHGDIEVNEDIDELYLDESFKGTIIEEHSKVLCSKYNIELNWIPKREIDINNIYDDFRGPMMKPLAKKIYNIYGERDGYINSYHIGRAYCNSKVSPENWQDIGTEDELFMYFKQIWHTLAFYGC